MNPNPVNLFFNDLKRFFTGRSALSRIMLINIGIFLILWIISSTIYLFNNNSGELSQATWISYLLFPADINVFFRQSWTILSYMFVNIHFWQFLFNMMVLYLAGLLLQQYKGERTILWSYLIGGLVGAVVFAGTYYLPAFQNARHTAFLISSTPSVLAVLTAAVYTLPNMEYKLLLLGKVKLKYIALIIFVFDILAIKSGQEGLYAAHIGGALGGFVYLYLKNRFAGQAVAYKPKMKVRKNIKPKRPLTDREFNEQRAVNQKRIDEILDKISQYGYDKLTKEEKEFLFKQK